MRPPAQPLVTADRLIIAAAAFGAFVFVVAIWNLISPFLGTRWLSIVLLFGALGVWHGLRRLRRARCRGKKLG